MAAHIRQAKQHLSLPVSPSMAAPTPQTWWVWSGSNFSSHTILRHATLYADHVRTPCGGPLWIKRPLISHWFSLFPHTNWYLLGLCTGRFPQKGRQPSLYFTQVLLQRLAWFKGINGNSSGISKNICLLIMAISWNLETEMLMYLKWFSVCLDQSRVTY